MTQKIDTLFINAIVLTMDEKLTQYDPGAVAVKMIRLSLLALKPI
jgi:hypothetical protein